ncbi:MAG: acetyltransferase [Desulfobacteraceae bacterium]|nr:acetyltransferase [Desulfobacteraceae bacterium]
MSKPEIILIGAGGHCRSCIDVIEQENRYAIAGVVEKPGADTAAKVFGYPVLGTDDDLSALRKDYQYALLAVGQIKSARPRIRLCERLLELDFELPAILSPLAYVSPRAKIGTGTIIMHHALVNAGAAIGANCIINTKALVEHDAAVEDHCHISTGAMINGGVRVGEGGFVGSGARIKEGVCLAPGNVVGMGLCIRVNQPENA